MPKVKIPRKSTSIDMTAMCDVAFLLLTFFMLTTKFKPDEVVVVDTPSSVSDVLLPETGILMITIDKEENVYFGMDGQFTRAEVLEKMGERYKIAFTPAEVQAFSVVSSFGVPINSMKEFLAKTPEERNHIKYKGGIPCDSAKNELADWVILSRQTNNKFNIAIKGDREAHYPIIKKVIEALKSKKVNKFHFITNLEQAAE